MPPLSNAIYFLRNKRRIIPVVAMIALAVIGVSVVAVVGNSQFENYRIAWEYPFREFAVVGIAPQDTSAPSIDSIRARDDVDRVLDAQLVQIRLPSLLGSITGPMFAVESDQIPYFMEHSELQVASGRLPAPDKTEIAIHETILLSRNLKIGDFVGRDVDDREFFRGRWEIVGALKGPVHTGIMPLEVAQSYTGQVSAAAVDRSAGLNNYLIFPKTGQMSSLDAFIRSYPRSTLNYFTGDSQKTILQREFDSAKLVIWIIDAVTIIVLSLATGLLNTIYFMQRMQEYGTLAAIGYKVRFLVRRTLSEAMSLTLFAWVFGLVLAQLTTLLLGAVLFTPNGYALASIDAQAVVFTIPIPILIALFSFFTVVRQFRRLDPVTIVEGRD